MRLTLKLAASEARGIPGHARIEQGVGTQENPSQLLLVLPDRSVTKVPLSHSSGAAERGRAGGTAGLALLLQLHLPLQA